MDRILTYKGAVMSWECDSNRHMNVMYYINKFEHAGRNFDIELGLYDKNSKDYIGIVVVEQKIKYVKEVFEDDLLFVRSELISIGNKAFTVAHEMLLTRTDQLVATMEVTLVRFDKIERKALIFPADRKNILKKRWQLS